MYYSHAKLAKQPLSTSLAILLILGFAAATYLRTSIGGRDVAQSAAAGLVFAACLIMLSLAAGVKTKITLRVIVAGLAGGIFLIIPALIADKGSGAHPHGNYLNWAAVVSIVAFSEELFFRGVLFDVIKKSGGTVAAIVVGALAFCSLHIPLYGWHVVPLDLAVGLFLGTLRSLSGSWIAPGISHVFADLTGWWLV
jgi:membrane protease YdiL (CAAX protease family)